MDHIKSTIAVWGCIVCSSVWASTGTSGGMIMGVVWMLFAVGILIALHLDSATPPAKEPTP